MKQTRIVFKTWLDNNIRTNGLRQITGAIHNTEVTDVINNSVWYDERTNCKYFPVEIKQADGFGGSAPSLVGYAGERFVQLWDKTATGMNADYGDIVYHDGTQWTIDLNFSLNGGQTSDWLVYNVQTNSHYRLDKKKYEYNMEVTLPADKISAWSNGLDIAKVIRHNELNGIEGGDASHKYHLTQAQLDKLNDVYNLKLRYLSVTVKEVRATAPPTPIDTAPWYCVNNKIVKYSDSMNHMLYSYLSPSWNPPSYPTVNYILLETSTGHNWIYNTNTHVFEDMGINIHADHSYLYNRLGAGDYHLSQDAATFSEQGVTRTKKFYAYAVESYYSSSALLPLPGVNGTRYLCDNGIYEFGGGAYSRIVDTTADNKEHWVLVKNTKIVYVSNYNNTAFVATGTNNPMIIDHNSEYGLQGGISGERYHLTLNEVQAIQNISSPAISQTIYVDTVNGDDMYNGSPNIGDNSAYPVKTYAGIAAAVNSKRVTLSIVPNSTILNLNPGSVFYDALLAAGTNYLKIGSTQVDQDSINYLNHRYNGVHEFTSDVSAHAWGTDKGSGLYYLSGSLMMGVNTFYDSTFTNQSLMLSSPTTFSAPPDLIRTISKIVQRVDFTTSADMSHLYVEIEYIRLASECKFGFLKALYSNIYTGQLFCDCELVKSSILATSYYLILYGNINFDDLLVSSADIGSSSTRLACNKLHGDQLVMSGFNYGFVEYSAGFGRLCFPDVKINDKFRVTGFRYIGDLRHGKGLNVQLPTDTLVACDKDHVHATYLIYDDTSNLASNEVVINVPNRVLTPGTTFDYRNNTLSSSSPYINTRNTRNVNLIHSLEEMEFNSKYFKISSLSSYSELLSNATCTTMKLTLFIREEGGNSYVSDVSISPTATTFITDGVAGALPAGIAIASSVVSGQTFLNFTSLNSSKVYHVKYFINRYFI